MSTCHINVSAPSSLPAEDFTPNAILTRNDCSRVIKESVNIDLGGVNPVEGENNTFTGDNTFSGELAVTGTVDVDGTSDFSDDVTLSGTAGLTVAGDTALSGNVGFFGTTPVAQQSLGAAALTTITFTAPGAADYDLTDGITNSSPFGFATADEANTVLSVIANLQDRVAALETALSNYGLTA